MGRQIIPAGDTLVLDMHGGGYGDPYTRDPALVATDVRNGLVSRAAAADMYGVVLNDEGAVAIAATEALRRES